MFCLAALSSRLLLASLSSTAFSRALIRSPWSSENAQNSQGTVSCSLPVARHHGQLFGSHPARAAGRQRPALPSRRPPARRARGGGRGWSRCPIRARINSGPHGSLPQSLPIARGEGLASSGDSMPGGRTLSLPASPAVRSVRSRVD